MTPPISTYRLQFRQGMTFERAKDLVPHLARLGISHLYASPITQAATGSTHGYDVTDFNTIDPALGGAKEFNLFCDALRLHGLALILDIVPNHMAASVENPWWYDVMARGQASAYSRHFDIDWRRRLTLPILEHHFAEEVCRGAFTLEADRGFASIRYHDVAYPLHADSETFTSLLASANLDGLARSTDFMARLHAAQAYEMIPWKEASSGLSYRRFFEISGLAGLRVEDPQVFNDIHSLVLALVDSGQVAGLRVDHIDGLVDPAAYLERLRAAAGPDVFVVVEKILVKGERLPQWPVAGTTGYEFIDASNAVLVSREGLVDLEETYKNLAPRASDLELARRQAQGEMVKKHFSGEVARLVEIAEEASEQNGLKPAIEEVLICFPRYRTYLSEKSSTIADRQVLSHTLAKASSNVADTETLDGVAGLIGCFDEPGGVAEFRDRFQQLTGPVLAKAVEDTLFYRYTRCLALNEVGCEATLPLEGFEGFHRHMRDRLVSQPEGLSATTTHDTKWSEDARCRLAAITEDAKSWATQFERWRSGGISRLEDGLEAGTEWMLLQALFAIMPTDFSSGALARVKQRLSSYMVKAAREAKTDTSWHAVNNAYEARLERRVAEIFSPGGTPSLREFHEFSKPFMTAGLVNSQVLTMLKLTAPGIPDFYQGCEYLQFALVDPDNRQPLPAGYPKGSHDTSPASLAKCRLITEGLKLRRARPELFLRGDYIPLYATGRQKAHVIGFARRYRDHQVVVIGSSRMLYRVDPRTLSAGQEFWQDTVMRLPDDFTNVLIDPVSGQRFDDTIDVSRALAGGPTALLISSPAGKP